MTARKSITLSLSVDSVEQLQRIGTAFFDEPKPKEPCSRTRTATASPGTRVRSSSGCASGSRRCSSNRSTIGSFEDQYLPGETPNEALLRMFRRRQTLNMIDEQTIESLAKIK